jgi:hypothetical protein
MQKLDSPVRGFNVIVPRMELLSDTYHLSANVLREMAVDVLNWLDWRIDEGEDGHLEVTVATEMGEARLEMEVVACGEMVGETRGEVQDKARGETQNPACVHCLRLRFPQQATGSISVLLDELHAAALKRTQT